MKHRISFYLTYACLVLFGTIGILILLLGEKAPRESESENRMLAGFPAFSADTVKNTSFMTGVEDYLSDGMPERDRIVTAIAKLMHTVSFSDEDAAEENVFEAIKTHQGTANEAVSPENVLAAADTPQPGAAEVPVPPQEPTDTAAPLVTAAAGSDPQQAEATSAPAQHEPAPTDAPPQKEPLAIPDDGCTFRRLLPDGQSSVSRRYPKHNIENAIEVLNAYRVVLPADGHVFFTQSPSAVTVRTMDDYGYVDWSSDLEEVLARNTLPGVEVVSTIDVLRGPLQAGEDLYFQTDHHWKPRAACYLAQAMLERIGIHAPDYDTYSYLQYDSFYGSVIRTHPELRGKIPPDSIDILVPILPTKGVVIKWDGTEEPCPFISKNHPGNYAAYLDGTYGPWRRYETGVNCDRKCLVIGDSFLNVLLPYLVPFYEEVHFANYKPENFLLGSVSWSTSEYIRANDIDDVYIIVCSENDINSEYMLELMRKYL